MNEPKNLPKDIPPPVDILDSDYEDFLVSWDDDEADLKELIKYNSED